MSKKQDETLGKILQHPTSGNIEWRKIERLFESLGGEVIEGHKGRFKVRLAGKEASFSRPHKKNLSDPNEIAAIRKFLASVGIQPAVAAGPKCLVAHVDHHETHLYEVEREGSVPVRLRAQKGDAIRSHAGKGGGRGDPAYLRAIGDALRGADEVALLGAEQGRSPTHLLLLKHLAAQAPDVLQAVVAIESVGYLTEDELLAEARRIFRD